MKPTLFDNSQMPPVYPDATQMWFISVDNRHMGPYSTEQLSAKLREGRLPQATAAWREGMTDWLALNRIAAFKAITSELPETTFTGWELPDELALDFAENDPTTIFEELVPKVAAPVIEEPVAAATIAPPLLGVETTILVQPSPASYEHSVAPTPKVLNPEEANRTAWAEFFDQQGLEAPKRISLRMPAGWKFGSIQIPQRKALGAAIIAGTLIIGGLTWFTVSPTDLPFREDMTRKDYREMQAVVGESLRMHGPAVAVAMSQSDLQTPIFYVGSNYPDGTRFNVRIDGIPEMLLERIKVSVEATVTGHRGVAKTPAFKEEDGKSFPRGEYRVTVQCITCEKVPEGTAGSKLVAPTVGQKTFFLGGTRDQDYDQRLKVYHEKLQQEAADEVVEIKQVSSTLEVQLRDTAKKFDEVLQARARDIQGPTTWPTFNANWTHLQDTMEALFQRWTPDALENGFVYGRVYSMLKDAGKKIQALHQEQTDYLVMRKVNPAIEAKIQSDQAEIDTLTQAIHERIKYIEQIPTTANGMPIRP